LLKNVPALTRSLARWLAHAILGESFLTSRRLAKMPLSENTQSVCTV
jgi:hypothetical protein